MTAPSRPAGRWPALMPFGGHIRVVAPATAVDESTLQPGLTWLRSLGWRVTEGAALYDRHRYMAGTDSMRAADLNGALADPEVHGIVSARGGYGSARLLESIDWESWGRRELPFVGFSDLTAFQLALYKRCGLISYSGFAPAADCRPNKPTDARIASSLSELMTQRRCRPVTGLTVVQPGAATGPLLGGCLSLVVSLLGTQWLPDLKGAILLLEDVGEHPYRIDRMLNQLQQAGVWQQISGLVFGEFFRCNDPNGYLTELMREAADQIDGPVVSGAPYGHQPSRQLLPIGAEATLLTPDTGILRFSSGEGRGLISDGQGVQIPPVAKG